MSADTTERIQLDADQAQKILDADLKNLVSKVSQGKPLTARERKLIQQASQERETAKTITELVALLGIPRTKYYKLKKETGAPDNLALDDWREFISRHRFEQIETEEMTPEKMTYLRGRLLAEKAQREKIERQLKELRLEREVGGFVPFTEAMDAVTRVLEPINRLLDGIPKAYSMRINPTDSDFAEEMLREMVRDLKRQISLSRGEKISKRKGVK